MAPSTHQLTISRTYHEANDILVVEFDLPTALRDQFSFEPGQYVTLVLPTAEGECRRNYSICSGSSEPLKIGIKRIPGGRLSTYAHQYFRVGEQVRVSPPAGSFVARETSAGRLKTMLIAAGSGITPILSLAKSLLASQQRHEVSLLYGNRRTTDIAFAEELLWLKNCHMDRFQWFNFISQERQETPLFNGRIDPQKFEQLSRLSMRWTDFDEYFLCGPAAMVQTLSAFFTRNGVAAQALHQELFYVPDRPARVASEPRHPSASTDLGFDTEVLIRHAGREVTLEIPTDGESILSAGLQQGLQLPYSCQGGVCATCKVKVIEGRVAMDVNHTLSDEEVAQGYALSCQAHPLSRRVVVDYDVI